MYIPPFIYGIFNSILYVWGLTWWIILPFLFFFIFADSWLIFKRLKNIRSIEWKLLEIKVPTDILKTPKAMEQVFAACHATYSFGFNFRAKYIEGKVEEWMSFEIVSIGGYIHFYIRVPKQYQSLIETAIYAQYQDAEIIEGQDYLNDLPTTFPNKIYEIFGSELLFTKDNAYPIKTYPSFEEITEERRLDSMAPIMEVLSRLKNNQRIFIQILIRPTGDAWKKAGEKLIEKLMGKQSSTKKSGLLYEINELLKDIFKALPIWPGVYLAGMSKSTQKESSLPKLTHGQEEVIKKIEEKISKIGFETTIRYIYIDKKDSFSRENIAALNGAFRQFNTQNLNAFKPNIEAMTVAKGMFKDIKIKNKKRLIFERYRSVMMNKTIILNTEELATLYHFPILAYKSSMIKKIEYKKGEPPPDLPVV